MNKTLDQELFEFLLATNAPRHLIDRYLEALRQEDIHQAFMGFPQPGKRTVNAMEKLRENSHWRMVIEHYASKGAPQN